MKLIEKKLFYIKGVLLIFLSISRIELIVAVVSEQGAAKDCEQFEEKPSIWDSKPIEAHDANIQILDKISGKVFRQNIKINSPVIFGNIKLNLKRCFKNSPEECKEVYAFIEIQENNEVIFSKWLFATSPSINLFSHPVYDVRVEF